MNSSYPSRYNRHRQKQKHSAQNSHEGERCVHPLPDRLQLPHSPFSTDVLTLTQQVYAAGSEDMDTLTFGAPVLLRHLTFSEARKTPISEIRLDKALEGLDMKMGQVRAVLYATDSRGLTYLVVVWTVHRPLPPPRVRLPRAHPRRRAQERTEARARVREPGRGARASAR